MVGSALRKAVTLIWKNETFERTVESNTVPPAFEELFLNLGGGSVDEIRREVDAAIASLLAAGKLTFRPDFQLGGFELECRTKLLFQNLGFTVRDGPLGLHDITILPSTGASHPFPVVVEIKSGKAPGPSRDDLRQLDDWVFDLSGEERARKGGLWGIDEFPRHHPTRHKGLMIYNGLLGTPFMQRPASWLGPNETTFANKHNLCIMRFETLLAWHKFITVDGDPLVKLWSAIHTTAGPLGISEAK